MSILKTMCALLLLCYYQSHPYIIAWMDSTSYISSESNNREVSELLIRLGADVDIQKHVSTPPVPIFQILYPCISPQACFYSTMFREETRPSLLSLIRRWRLTSCFSEDNLCFTSSSLLAHRAPVVSWGWRGTGTWWDIRLCFCEKLTSPASFLSSEHPESTEQSTAS